MARDEERQHSEQTSPFDAIRQIDSDNREFWSARELYVLLEYKHWQDFSKVLQEAMMVYRNSGGADVDTIFRKVSKQTLRKSGRPYTAIDYHLTRHACYLTVLSADGSKPVISQAKSYFAVTTRLHELAPTQEDRLRLERREVLREQNRALATYAQQAGVITNEQYAIFWNAGYMGLYRESARQIRARKNITARQDIGDYASSSELAANIMKASLARDMMMTRRVSDPDTATSTHFEAGNHVRTMLQNAGVPTPEFLPTPKKSYKQLLQEQIEREQIAAQDQQGLWAQIQEGAIQEDVKNPSFPISFGIKITLTPHGDDTEILLESIAEPVEGAAYSSLTLSEPVPTHLNLFWLPALPPDEVKDEVMIALADYLSEIINQDEQLKAIYGNQPPFQA
jgi:DNA-damage-inducible protein D